MGSRGGGAQVNKETPHGVVAKVIQFNTIFNNLKLTELSKFELY